MTTSLLERTQAQLQNAIKAGISLREIAEGSEGRVVYEWLKKFAAGKIDDPGVQKIEGLHARLSELPQVQPRPN